MALALTGLFGGTLEQWDVGPKWAQRPTARGLVGGGAYVPLMEPISARQAAALLAEAEVELLDVLVLAQGGGLLAVLYVLADFGAEVVKVCPRAMTISGTLEEWRGWTGLPFDTSGHP